MMTNPDMITRVALPLLPRPRRGLRGIVLIVCVCLSVCVSVCVSCQYLGILFFGY